MIRIHPFRFWVAAGIPHLICITLLSTSRGFAFSGTEGASFLDLPVGARPAAFGSAYTALAEDAYAPTWNAAGLAFLPGAQLAGMHVIYLEDTAYEYASFVTPLGQRHGLGVSAQYFRPGDIEGRDLTGNEIGDVGGHFAAYSLAYGFRVTDAFSLGVTGKLIEAQIDDVKAQAVAGDVGFLYKWSKRLRAGLSATNYGQSIKFLQESDPLPASIRLGGAWSPRRELTLALEGAHSQAGVNSAHLGVEWMNWQGFSFRSGYSTDRIRELSKLAGLSVGAGMAVFQHELSYTVVPLGGLGVTHYLSFLMRFGIRREDRDDEFTLQSTETGGSYQMLQNLDTMDLDTLEQEQPVQ